MKVLDLCLPTKGSLSKDLNGDEQISTTARADGHGVLFDVDNDGYAEETDWIGPREGILVLDRNGDGQINVASDLFNDYGVHSSSRRLSVLNEINADIGYYGTLDSNDPVFGQLKVWMDINGDGVAQKGELQSMAQLGITRLDWDALNQPNSGTFVQNGQTKLMQTAYLEAQAAGVVTKVAGNSLLVVREEGGTDLYAQSVLDYGANASTKAVHERSTADGVLTATDELLDGQEDTVITISVAQLLRNDKSAAGGVVGFEGKQAKQRNETLCATKLVARGPRKQLKKNSSVVCISKRSCRSISW